MDSDSIKWKKDYKYLNLCLLEYEKNSKKSIIVYLIFMLIILIENQLIQSLTFLIRN